MDPLLNLSPDPCCEQPVAKCCDVTPTMEQSLSEKRQRLTNQLKDLDAAIEALKANPGITSVLELIRKVNRY